MAKMESLEFEGNKFQQVKFHESCWTLGIFDDQKRHDDKKNHSAHLRLENSSQQKFHAPCTRVYQVTCWYIEDMEVCNLQLWRLEELLLRKDAFLFEFFFDLKTIFFFWEEGKRINFMH
jgi:hypothetical protein